MSWIVLISYDKHMRRHTKFGQRNRQLCHAKNRAMQLIAKSITILLRFDWTHLVSFVLQNTLQNFAGCFLGEGFALRMNDIGVNLDVLL